MMRRCVDFLVDAVPTQLASRGGVVSPVQPKAHNANFFQTGQQDIREDTGNEILDLPTERTFTNDERGYANIADFSFLPTELQIATDAGPGDCSSSSSSLYTSDGGIQIAMCFLVGCGGHLWPSAVVLSRYLLHMSQTDPSRLSHKTCIELGAGTGVVALALASLRIPGLQIYSTDLKELLPLAMRNVALNAMQDRVKVAELEWGKPLPDDVPHQPDLILLADCIYLEPTFPMLVDTLRLLCSDKTNILLCYKKRRKADKRFFVLLKKQFAYEEVLDDPYKPVYEREGLFLYRLTRR